MHVPNILPRQRIVSHSQIHTGDRAGLEGLPYPATPCHDETSLSNTHLNGNAWSQKTAGLCFLTRTVF